MKIGICLSGCGVNDGSEIHETTLALLHVVKAGATPIFMAPDIKQYDVIDHKASEATGEKRNVLVESARIARGEILNTVDVDVAGLDALIFPGGFGAAKNISNFARVDNTAAMQVDESVARLVQQMVKAEKPLGFICIAPASIAAVCLPEKGVKLTIGHDIATAEKITGLGHEHVPARVDEIVTDEANKVVSTPAYMLAQDIAEAEAGISQLVAKVVELAQANAKIEAA